MRLVWVAALLTSACGGAVSGEPADPVGGAGGVGGSSASGGASASGGTAASGGAGTGGAAASGGSAASGGTAGSVVCPDTSRGPALVPAGVIAGAAFCIDRTEVTEEQFDLFLRDVKDPQAVPELLPEVCAYKERFGPVNFRSNLIYPMGNVDWCDAAAFCDWAGKRLCRAVGDPDYALAVPSATNSEWNYACSNGGTQRFPWGNDPQPLACNARCRDNCRSDLREKVATRTTCQGGIEGVYDLGGNQTEWVDWCDFHDPAYPSCRVQGGFWHDLSLAHESDEGAGDCQTNEANSIEKTRDEIGFRCCADATLE